MKINQLGLDLVKGFEGLRLRAYLDAVKVVTIGYGHTRTAKMGLIITEAKAERLLRDDLHGAEGDVARLVKVELNGNEHAALVSFVFNLGAANFAKSTLLKKLNVGDRVGAASEFLKWNRARGKILAGLTRRRKAERELFLERIER